MPKFCYGEFCSEDFDKVCEYIAEHEIYITEEGLLQKIENEIILLDSDE